MVDHKNSAKVCFNRSDSQVETSAKRVHTTPHQRASAKLEKWAALSSFSARKTRKDEKISPRKPMYNVVNNSCK